MKLRSLEHLTHLCLFSHRFPFMSLHLVFKCVVFVVCYLVLVWVAPSRLPGSGFTMSDHGSVGDAENTGGQEQGPSGGGVPPPRVDVSSLVQQLQGLPVEERDQILQAIGVQPPMPGPVSPGGSPPHAPAPGHVPPGVGLQHPPLPGTTPNPFRPTSPGGYFPLSPGSYQAYPYPPPPPRLSQFSASGDTKEISYAQWRAEVVALQHDATISGPYLLQLIRRSLKGKAASTLLTLGDTTVSELLKVFDSRYGEVQSLEMLLGLFHTARQSPKEAVASWAGRLEELISKVACKDPTLSEEMRIRMLRNKFWSGLYSQALKDSLRYKVDSSDSYEQVLIAARMYELETMPSVNVNQVKDDSPLSNLVQKIDQIGSRLHTIEQRLTNLETTPKPRSGISATSEGPRPLLSPIGHANNPTSSPTPKFRGKCFKCHRFGHKSAGCPLNIQGSGSQG